MAIENRLINANVGAERICHGVTDPYGPSHQFVATTGATQCAPASVLKEPGASPPDCDRPPQKMQNYRLLDTPRLGQAVPGQNQRFLNFKPFYEGPFGPKSGDSNRDDSSPNSGTFLKFSTRFCHVLRHVSQTFNFKNFVMSSENFLTLQKYRHVRFTFNFFPFGGFVVYC